MTTTTMSGATLLRDTLPPFAVIASAVAWVCATLSRCLQQGVHHEVSAAALWPSCHLNLRQLMLGSAVYARSALHFPMQSSRDAPSDLPGDEDVLIRKFCSLRKHLAR